MMDCKTGTSYRIEVENFADARLSNVKVMICQLDFDKMHHTKGVRLHFVDNDSGNRAYLKGSGDLIRSIGIIKPSPNPTSLDPSELAFAA